METSILYKELAIALVRGTADAVPKGAADSLVLELSSHDLQPGIRHRLLKNEDPVPGGPCGEAILQIDLGDICEKFLPGEIEERDSLLTGLNALDALGSKEGFHDPNRC
jgi:hypothetical protein